MLWVCCLLIVTALALVCCTDRSDTHVPAEPHASATDAPHTNRLAQSTSPYLRQHAHNPVDWYEWGEEALAAAREQDKPIFLSVGYSTCHWCHVMAHESFEDEEVAAVLNEHFIAIKVDREQRPDIDAQYMMATQLMTQRGGWPNSVWLTPDGRPWFAGTYFPRHDAMGRPGFITVLNRLAEVWANQRDDVEKQADQLAAAIRQAEQVTPGDAPLGRGLVEATVEQLRQTFDGVEGGFGRAPKFPPHAALRLLIHEAKRTGDDELNAMVTKTLDAMAAGGIHDHIGGGFHRYATDRNWLVPHFEKMLYDNAQLMRNFAAAHVLTGDPAYRQVCDGIVAWIDREMTDEAGGFYSALDADSEGEEGRFYVWSVDEVRSVLGEDDAQAFAAAYGMAEAGNWHEEATGQPAGTNIAHLPRPIDELAEASNVDAQQLTAALAEMRNRLLAVRNQRVHPHLDDKVLAGWNAMMIDALARAGVAFDEPGYIERATRAATFIIDQMIDDDGRLMRVWRDGAASHPAYLDDYAFMVTAMLSLHRATGDERWLEHATRLADAMVELFHDDRAGGFYNSALDHEELLGRSKAATGGGNTPSGNGAAAMALVELARATGDQRYAELAGGTLQLFADTMQRWPTGVETLVHATAMYLDDHAETGEDSAEATPDRAKAGPIRVRLELPDGAAGAGGAGETIIATLHVEVESNWHVYAPSSEAAGVRPMQVSVRSGGALAGVNWPDASQIIDPVLGKPIGVYSGKVTLPIEITLPADASDALPIELQVQAQACDDARCLEPVTLRVAGQVMIRAGD